MNAAKKTPLSAFRVELIFLIITITNIVFSIFLKTKAERKFIEEDSFLYSVEIALLGDSENLDFNLIQKFNNEFIPYTYFNKELEEDFKKLCNQLSSPSTINPLTFIKDLKSFNIQLKSENRRINFGYDSMIYSSLILIAVTVILMIINNAAQKKEIEKLNIHNEEQRKISQELHDGVAQDMSALLMFLEQNDIEKSTFAAKKALSEIRFMIGMQHIDLSAGFETILKNTATTFEQNYGIKTEFLSAISQDLKLSAQTQLDLLRIVQEALNNIAHHAKATFVTVKLLNFNKTLNLSISDNGIGLQQPSDDRKHYGLENIKNRTQNSGGTFQIKSENGTTILISIPV